MSDPSATVVKERVTGRRANVPGRDRHLMRGVDVSKRTCAVDGCEKPFLALGYCAAHHARFKKYGDPLGVAPRRSLEERFWEKVNKDGPIPEFRPDLGPCWLWEASCDQYGYGRLGVWKKGKTVPRQAYRIAYELSVGPIADGLTLDHLCRVPACVNPAHLEPVTKSENERRGLRGVLTTHCPQGHPYDAANTYVDPKGGRRCRICARTANRERYRSRTRTR